MMNRADAPIPFEYATEERAPGEWIADVIVTGTGLELQEVVLYAPDVVAVEWQLAKLVRRMVNRIARPPRIMLN